MLTVEVTHTLGAFLPLCIITNILLTVRSNWIHFKSHSDALFSISIHTFISNIFTPPLLHSNCFIICIMNSYYTINMVYPELALALHAHVLSFIQPILVLCWVLTNRVTSVRYFFHQRHFFVWQNIFYSLCDLPLQWRRISTILS